jgi:putative spermidine/putrescine transport system ATP-binding protein
VTTRSASAAGIHLQGITKSYKGQPVLHGLDLDVAPGEFVSMLGPSGSGKTTTLKMIAGFEEADSGRVTLGGRDMTGTPPERRNIGVVFQNYSLFPHMNVGANVGFPLRMRGIPKTERQDQIRRALDLVELGGYEGRGPRELSGGQQQRVAIARALVFEPQVLLMDEPLGALDRRLRAVMQMEIKALHERLGLTVVYVTHDQEEALAMSDRIVVFNAGRIEQVGTPREVYRTPATLFVADFLGDSLSVSCTVGGGKAQLADGAGVVSLDGVAAPDGRAKFLWRSDGVALAGPIDQVTQSGTTVTIPATVLTSAYSGEAVRLRLRLATGDVGIATVEDDGALLPAGTAAAVRFDLSTAMALRVPNAASSTEEPLREAGQ